jgi:hypothetical protein
MRLTPSRGIVAPSVSSGAPLRQNSDAASPTTFSAAIVAVSAGSSRLWGHTRVIDRAVYGTIVVTSVLVGYDGWANLRVLGAVVIILGPVVAMVIGHVFAATLAAYPTLGRRPMRRELLEIVRHESHFLLVCAPQLILLPLLSLVGLSVSDTVRVLIWAGAASLGFWGGLAGQRAGLRWRGIAVGVVTGLAAGGAVLLMQVFLQPGKVVSNGVAAIELTPGRSASRTGSARSRLPPPGSAERRADTRLLACGGPRRQAGSIAAPLPGTKAGPVALGHVPQSSSAAVPGPATRPHCSYS